MFGSSPWGGMSRNGTPSMRRSDQSAKTIASLVLGSNLSRLVVTLTTRSRETLTNRSSPASAARGLRVMARGPAGLGARTGAGGVGGALTAATGFWAGFGPTAIFGFESPLRKYAAVRANSSAAAPPAAPHTHFGMPRASSSDGRGRRRGRIVLVLAGVSGSPTTLPVVGAGSHGPSASITSSGVWYRSAGRFAIILTTTSANAGGTRPASFFVRLGGSFNWCWISFCVVEPVNGGWPATSAYRVAPRL